MESVAPPGNETENPSQSGRHNRRWPVGKVERLNSFSIKGQMRPARLFGVQALACRTATSSDSPTGRRQALPRREPRQPVNIIGTTSLPPPAPSPPPPLLHRLVIQHLRLRQQHAGQTHLTFRAAPVRKRPRLSPAFSTPPQLIPSVRRVKGVRPDPRQASETCICSHAPSMLIWVCASLPAIRAAGIEPALRTSQTCCLCRIGLRPARGGKREVLETSRR